MSPLREMIYLLCTDPTRSGRSLAKQLGKLPDTVLRYRSMIQERGLTWQDLGGLSEGELNATFNRPRHQTSKKTVPDLERVAAVLSRPNATLRDAWEDYRANQPVPHLSLPTFRAYVGQYWQRPPYAPTGLAGPPA